MLGLGDGSSLAEQLGMSLATRGFAVVLMLLAGCNLYFTGDDECDYDYGAPAPALELRNPQSGQCEAFGGGGGCDSPCGPCALDLIALPDWGACQSECEALDESSCLGATGCRAAYSNSARNDGPAAFRGCWAVAPSGPVQGSCENLDAQECSRHDDCSAFYNDNLGPNDAVESSDFARCAPESFQSCFGDEECGAGAHCSTSDGECLPSPGCTGDMACPQVCAGRCVMDNDSCSAVDCGPGSHCEEQCYPCDSTDPTKTCDPICQPLCVPDQACDSTTCPPGSECVQKCDGMDPNNPGCGVCTISCEPTGSACEAIPSESACAARHDCTPVYEGTDCTCYPNGPCECQILTYERCESLTP